MYSPQVGQAFDASMDRAFPTQLYISALLERNIKVLIYVGANDWICNWVSGIFDVFYASVDPRQNKPTQ